MAITFHGATTGLSEYSISALDVAMLDGEVYFLTATALVKLSGALTGTSSIETGDLSFVPGSTCNVSRVYLDVGSDANLTLTATSSTYGAAKTAQYVIPARTGDESRARTVPLGKGPRGVDWTLKMGASSGAWTLKSLEVVPERVSRLR